MRMSDVLIDAVKAGGGLSKGLFSVLMRKEKGNLQCVIKHKIIYTKKMLTLVLK